MPKQQKDLPAACGLSVHQLFYHFIPSICLLHWVFYIVFHRHYGAKYPLVGPQGRKDIKLTNAVLLEWDKKCRMFFFFILSWLIIVTRTLKMLFLLQLYHQMDRRVSTFHFRNVEFLLDSHLTPVRLTERVNWWTTPKTGLLNSSILTN